MSCNVFVEPRSIAQNRMSSDEDVSHMSDMRSSTPINGRRYSADAQNLNYGQFFNASPLIKPANYEWPRVPSRGASPLFDSPHRFALNSLSICNDSGISDNECSFPTVHKSVRSLQQDLMNETPPGVFYEDDEILVQPHSDDEECDTLRAKRSLSDSYIKLKERSPSVSQMKRSSGESVESDMMPLPLVPNCFDTSYGRPPLIGDDSREYLLPCVPNCNSEHCDFKCVTSRTLADLLRGNFSHIVDQFIIVDTRYPYEFEGGHIQGAVNVYTKDEMAKDYLSSPDIASTKQVVIFHCEFSSKRGPSMCRYVRDQDRMLNTHRYPHLYYPEIYILHGGYKEFYPLHTDLCTPQGYVLMLDPAHTEDLTYWQKACKIPGSEGHTGVRGMKHRTKSSRQLKLS